MSKIVNYTKIKELSKEQGISFAHLNRLLGKSPEYLRICALSSAKLSDDQIAIIAEALHTTPEYLTDQTEQKEKEPVQDKLFEEYYSIFRQLTPEQKEREIAYIRSLVDQAK